MKVYMVTREKYYDDFSSHGVRINFTALYMNREAAREKAKELAEEYKNKYEWNQEEMDDGPIEYIWKPDKYSIVGPFHYWDWGFSVDVKEVEVIE